jgi:hypothetical protein
VTPGEAAKIIDEVGKLWPKRVRAGEESHPWTEAAQDVYHATLCHKSLADINEEQGLAVVRQLKREGVFVPNDRGWKILIDRMRDVSRRVDETPGVKRFVDEHPHTLDDGTVDTGPIRSTGDWRRLNAAADKAIMAEACTCPRHESVMFPRTMHRLGGTACNACGGSMIGKELVYRKNNTQARTRRRESDGRTRDTQARVLDISLGLTR